VARLLTWRGKKSNDSGFVKIKTMEKRKTRHICQVLKKKEMSPPNFLSVKTFFRNEGKTKAFRMMEKQEFVPAELPSKNG
jgi:hypothetical protein